MNILFFKFKICGSFLFCTAISDFIMRELPSPVFQTYSGLTKVFWLSILFSFFLMSVLSFSIDPGLIDGIYTYTITIIKKPIKTKKLSALYT